VRLIVAALAVSLLFLQLRTFNGLSAGTALLALMAGLKLLETDTRRDIYIVTLIIYFVCVSALLQSDSFWLLAYLIGVCWLTSATLLRLTTSLPAPAGRAACVMRESCWARHFRWRWCSGCSSRVSQGPCGSCPMAANPREPV